jgi:hypothetical protein
LEIPLKTQKQKKVSRGEGNDYGKENKLFINLIFSVNKKNKPIKFAQRGLFPHPNFSAHLIISDRMKLQISCTPWFLQCCFSQNIHWLKGSNKTTLI